MGDREGDDGEGGNGVGQMRRGQQEGGDREVGRREREKKGHKEGGISQMDMKCLGGHMECLGGTRLESFLTLFTCATPGTTASKQISKQSPVLLV